jgi:membrane associated rhomboid family serine protease
VPDSEETLEIDICRRCQFVWFDTREFERTPSVAPRKPEMKPLVSPASREAVAVWEAERVGRRQADQGYEEEAPAEAWKWLPAVLGLPVEQDVEPVSCWPWVTWGLAAAFALVFFVTSGNLGEIVKGYGLVPAEFWRLGGLTFVTSFFLHGGLGHLIGNVYFLLVFGDNVEDFLGRWKYVGLVAAAALVGDAAHIMCDTSSAIPCIGASGGISGVIVFYAMKFPEARLGFMVRHYYVWRWVCMPAFVALILWLLLQFGLAYLQVAGFSNVSAFAHLGGAGAGFFAWLVSKDR